MSRRAAAALFLAALAAACHSRPEWADGHMVREERAAGAKPQDLSRIEARLLTIHNRARSAAGAPPVIWDERLAAAAAAYGPSLQRLGKLAHSPPATRPGQGENLWMGTHGAYSVEEMAGGWVAEKSLFRSGVFPDVSRSGHWSDVAHYTQMIWKGSSRVGCALHRSRAWDFLICRYSPPGNVIGQRVP
jgi:uncharacterized protein YkwD